MFSVELVPDASAERAVLDDWAALQAAGLPNSGRNPSPSNRPHVTVAVREHVDTDALTGAEDLLPVPLELGGLLLFRHSRNVVVTRHVVVTTELLALHREIAARLGPPGPRYANTGPGRWTPHVTLARSVTPELLPQVLDAIAAPHIVGQATGLRVWDASAKAITTLR